MKNKVKRNFYKKNIALHNKNYFESTSDAYVHNLNYYVFNFDKQSKLKIKFIFIKFLFKNFIFNNFLLSYLNLNFYNSNKTNSLLNYFFIFNCFFFNFYNDNMFMYLKLIDNNKNHFY